MPSTGFANEHLDDILDSIDDYLYPVNTFIAYHLLNKNYSYLKTLPKSSEISVERYAQLTSELTLSQTVIARAFANDLFNTQHISYAFIGSKKLFKTLAFNSFLPSDYNTIIAELTANNYIKIVGQGSGSVVLLNTHKLDQPFVVHSFNNSDSFHSSISSFVDSFVDVISEVADSVFLFFPPQETKVKRNKIANKFFIFFVLKYFKMY